MNATQICPGCQVRLVVRDRVRTEFITCPRCLTPVANPHRTGAAPAAGAPAAPRRAVPAGAPVCTICAELMPHHASNCPANPERQAAPPAWSAPAADSEARSDSSGTFSLAVILAGMTLLGTLGTFGPEAAAVVGVALGIAMTIGGRERALGNIARMILGLMLTGFVIAVLGFIALLILCGGLAKGVGKY